MTVAVIDNRIEEACSLPPATLKNTSKTVVPSNIEFVQCMLIIVIIYLFQAARPISQHNIHIEGKKRKEKKTLKHLTLILDNDMHVSDRHTLMYVFTM